MKLVTDAPYNADPTGVADAAPAIAACLAANNNVCQIPYGTFSFQTPLNVPQGAFIFATNAKLVLHPSNPAQKIINLADKGGCTFKGRASLLGTGSGDPDAATDAGEILFYAENPQNLLIEGWRADLAEGRGLVVTGAISGPFHGDCCSITDWGGTGNWLAVDLQAIEGGGSQYGLFNTPSLVGNRQAIKHAAGNWQINGGNVVMNRYGYELIGAPAPAHAHGMTSHVNINHNRHWNLYAEDITQGHDFIACHIYGDVGGNQGEIIEGDLILNNCRNVRFIGGMYNCRIQHTGPDAGNYITDGIFPGSYMQLTGANPENFHIYGRNQYGLPVARAGAL